MSGATGNNLEIETGADENAAGTSEISEQLISLIEQAPVAIALFDCNMRYLAANRHWNASYGRSGASLTGLSHYDVFPQTPAKWREVHRRVLSGEEIACDEDPVLWTDGRADWVRWSIKPWRHPNGEVRGALAFRELITPQIEARREIATSEALFRQTFENAPVGIAHVAPDGRWLLVNPRLCKMTGYAAAEFITKTVKDLTHPEDFEAHLPEIKSMYRAEIDSFDMEKRYIHKDGSIVWVRLRVSCVRKDGGAIDHFIAVIVDISQQKMAELALRESEERFRGIFERAGTGIAIMDLCGRFQSCNPAYSAMLGYTGEELRELTCADLIHPSDCAANKVQQDRLVAGHIPSFEIVSRYLSKEGGILWGHRHLSLLRDGVDRPTHIMALVTDITDHKRAEAARAADRAKSKFLANVSHELRTPMNGIMGFNELLLQTELTKPQKEYAEIIRSSSTSLLALIEDILDLEKIERGGFDLRQRLFVLAELISAARSLEVLAAKKSLNFQIRCDLPEDTSLFGDLPRIRQILTNLLGNAIKFTDSGTVEVVISREGADLRLDIADTGCGIPAEDLAIIFDWFYRCEASSSRKVPGSGLGLSIAKELIEFMGGKIAATSQVGRGTTFTVFFPLFQLSPEAGITSIPSSESAPAKMGGASGSYDVLIAEDNPISLKLASAVLDAAGFQVECAEDGSQALARLNEADFDLIVMDSQMPAVTGIEAIKAIRNRHDWKRLIPILSLTADAMKGAKEQCLSTGADLYMSKPLNLDNLRESAKALAEKGRILRRELTRCAQLR
jgi:PAS domain S-box-containing protein